MSAPSASSKPVASLEVEKAEGKPAVLAVDPGGDPAGWAAAHRGAVRAAVDEHGAVVVRGLGLADAGQVAAVTRALVDGTMPETEAFAPRADLGAGVLSATPWPAGQQMCMHHELSYTLRFPGLLLFAGLRPADGGGDTGLADATAVLQALPEDLVQRFRHEGWLLVRNYNEDIGASVAESFGTDDRGAVEAYCRANGIEFEWQGDGGLRTVQRRAAVVTHPGSGARTWFNQIAFLSEWTMDEEVREFLVEVNGPDGLPFTTRYGDGSPIEEGTIAVLNEVYDAHTDRLAWQAGDLLVVDNIRTAHSRDPYTGDRQVVAVLAEPVALADLSPEFGAAR